MAVVEHGVSTDTPDRVLLNAGAVYLGFYDATNTGTLLGATKGGNTFEVNQTVRDIRPDGSAGPIKGFRRIEEVVVTLKVNMLEFTAENLRRAIAGAAYSAGTTTITTENCGNGNGVLTEFDLDHNPVVENSEIVYIEGVAQTRGTNYTMDYDAGTIQFVSAPGSGESYTITCTYDYVSGSGAFTGGEIDDTAATGSYVDNVTLVMKLSGYTNPAIFQLENCLMTAPFTLNGAPKDEAVSVLTFTGHYAVTALTTPPWSVEYPAS